ncbi:MAG: hypothetical protein ABIG44_16545 [Planctomycetota bacterium]
MLLPAVLVVDLACADIVKLHNKPPFHHVHISDFRAGRVVFRGVSKQYLRKPLDQIEWLKLDACPALGVAERAAAAGQYNLAVTAYRQALNQATQPWLSDLIRYRLLTTCDRSARFTEAVEIYVDLLNRQGDTTLLPSPRNPEPPGSAGNAQALDIVQTTLAATESAPVRRRLLILALELRLYENSDNIPITSSPSGPSATSAPVRSPLLGLPLPTRKSARLKLPGDSFLITAARNALDTNDNQRARSLIERAWPYIDTAEQNPWRLVLGRAKLAAGDAAQASVDLLALSETAADPVVATTALYYLGAAHEQMNQVDTAIQLYHEVLRHPETSDSIRHLAGEALARLGE